MRIAYLVLICIMTIMACQRDYEVKPMKYTRNGENFSCNGHYKNDTLIKVVCFSPKRDTILIEHYEEGIRSGVFTSWYPPEKIKEIGKYKKDQKEGKWLTYYPNGTLKSYEYYVIDNDSFNQFYEKVYNENGNLFSMMLPIDYRTNSDEYKVGITYQLFVELKYSEYDSINTLGIVKAAPESSIKEDTTLFSGKSLYYEFTPKSEGYHSISGILYEINGFTNLDSLDEMKVAEKPFRFDYNAIK